MQKKRISYTKITLLLTIHKEHRQYMGLALPLSHLQLIIDSRKCMEAYNCGTKCDTFTIV